MLRLVVTGTRTNERPDVFYWLDRWVRRYGEPELVILGDARGVDTMAKAWAQAHGYEHVIKYVDKSYPSPLRYHLRNQAMVDAARTGDWCVGFPIPTSSGTYDCVRRAKRACLFTAFPPLHLAA